jgi:Tfp pilus assembly protein PilF
MGEADKALTACRKAVSLDPNSGIAHLTLAYVYFHAKDQAQAKEQLDKALLLGQDVPQDLVAQIRGQGR